MLLEILTIGVYGFTEASFFNSITQSGTDCFVDIRQRRGLRGAQYAFANSTRLQNQLELNGIKYRHLHLLAPTEEVRETQRIADQQQCNSKRSREKLSQSFIKAYTECCLSCCQPGLVLKLLPIETQRPLLFCVERLPDACHRSLVADWLSKSSNVPVRHIHP